MAAAANTPFDLLFDPLRDIYSMEVQFGESMSYLLSLCMNENLRGLLVGHTGQNRSQVAEIAAIFEWRGKYPSDDKCKAIEGLIEGAPPILKKMSPVPALDGR